LVYVGINFESKDILDDRALASHEQRGKWIVIFSAWNLVLWTPVNKDFIVSVDRLRGSFCRVRYMSTFLKGEWKPVDD